MPSRFREPLSVSAEGKLVVTIDMREQCLLLYPLPEWEVVQRKLESLSNIGDKARRLQRLLIGHATDLELDAQGVRRSGKEAGAGRAGQQGGDLELGSLAGADVQLAQGRHRSVER